MLRELHIRNYALIERLECQFMPGLNILTGGNWSRQIDHHRCSVYRPRRAGNR